MALYNTARKTYLTVFDGKFTRRVDEGTIGAVSRMTKPVSGEGKLVHELYYSNLSGKITDIYTRDGIYGKTWNIDISDGTEKYSLQFGYSDGLAIAFLKMLPNVNLDKDVVFSVTKKLDPKDNKEKTSLFLNQDGEPIKHAYSLANPNGLPEMKMIVVNGKEVWDSTERLAFLQNMVDTQIIPKLNREVELAQIPASENEKPFPTEFSDFDAPKDEGHLDIDPDDIGF